VHVLIPELDHIVLKTLEAEEKLFGKTGIRLQQLLDGNHAQFVLDQPREHHRQITHQRGVLFQVEKEQVEDAFAAVYGVVEIVRVHPHYPQDA